MTAYADRLRPRSVGASRRGLGRLHEWLATARATFDAWMAVSPARYGAALSYYAVFSLGPLLIVVVAVATQFFGEEAVRGELARTLTSVLGDVASKAVESLVSNAYAPRQGAWAAVLGGGTLAIAAAGVVVQLKDALDAVWGTDTSHESTIKHFLRSYVVSFGALLGLGFVLIVSLVVSTAISLVATYFSAWLPVPAPLLEGLNTLASFGIAALLFTLMLRYLPDVRVAWRDAARGAIVTALLFMAGKTALGVYLGTRALASTYGAAAAVVAVMIWVYFMSQVFLLGAAFTKVLDKQGLEKRGGDPDRRRREEERPDERRHPGSDDEPPPERQPWRERRAKQVKKRRRVPGVPRTSSDPLP